MNNHVSNYTDLSLRFRFLILQKRTDSESFNEESDSTSAIYGFHSLHRYE